MNGLGFLDVVDRFSGLATTLKIRASHPSPSKSHYTEVILSTEPIVNTVREADPMEAALFTVVPPSHGEGPSVVDLKRKELASATPLRKAREAPLALLDPDEYLTSALRLGEKYSVMPRAQARAKELQERTQSTKKRIYELEESLKDLQSSLSSSSVSKSSPRAQKLSVKNEEQKTRDMEGRVAAARRKRDGLLNRANKGPSLDQGKGSPAPPSTEEAAFWSVPFSNSSSRQTDSVETSVDDEGDEGTEGDTSATDSPSFRAPQNRVQVPPLRWSLAAGRRGDDDMETDSAADTTLEASATPEEPEEEEEDGDATVVLVKPPPPRRTFSLLRNSIVRSSEIPPSSSPPASHMAPAVPSQVPPLAPSAYTPNPESLSVPQAPISLELPPDTSKPSFPFEITLALQEHTAQVWRTIGDLLIPNNPYDTGPGEGRPPPSARETISLLTTLGSLPVANIDPAPHDAVAKLLAEHGAMSPIPPPHALQVITAQLVLLLLSAPGPSHTISRSALKDALKANPWAVEAAGDTDWGTKAIYYCVGKKLISIDRKEGMVRFAPNK